MACTEASEGSRQTGRRDKYVNNRKQHDMIAEYQGYGEFHGLITEFYFMFVFPH